MATSPAAARKPATAPAAPPARKAGSTVAEEAPARPAKRSRRGLAIGALIVAVAGGAGGWYVLQHSSAEAKAVAPEPRKQQIFVPVDAFTVNLASPGIDRYLQVGVTFEMGSGAAADELKRQMPVIRSRVLLLLAAKTPEELATTPGKQKLMAELLAEARAPMPESEGASRGVEHVHFSSFVIQ
jgi:flagellar FliL protein